jgi:Tfp pilus assembly protein PilN
MRPVNLIPPEDRHGENAPMRTGPVVYIVVGFMVVALAGVSALVLTGNQIADHKAEVAQLGQEDAALHARAQKLAAYSQFRSLKEQRVATVTSLADSRFDWERVMRELSRVLPSYVWLTTLEATDAPSVSIGSGSSEGSAGSSGLRAAVNGPALEMTGCAVSQDGVAGFVTALKDIDGVTRVGVQSSALPTAAAGSGGSAGSAGSGSGGGGASTDCRTRDFIAKFQIVVAFDAAPIPTSATSSGGATTSTPSTQSTTPSTQSSESSGSSTTSTTSSAGG